MTDEKLPEEDAQEKDSGCPYGTEECTGGQCDLCRADAFAYDVAKIVLGTVLKKDALSKPMLIAELSMLVKKGREALRENTLLKTKAGGLGIEIDQIKGEMIQIKTRESASADIAIKASQALSRLQASYGDDLTWDNLVERAGGAVMRLQAQAPLMQAAEGELIRMRERLAELEGVGPSPSPRVPSRTVAAEDLQQRLASLEADMGVFRLIGRVGSRLFGLDRS